MSEEKKSKEESDPKDDKANLLFALTSFILD